LTARTLTDLDAVVSQLADVGSVLWVVVRLVVKAGGGALDHHQSQECDEDEDSWETLGDGRHDSLLLVDDV
jgi:MoaA/NifB/PqqE/SkfB family radical SAM enzyme